MKKEFDVQDFILKLKGLVTDNNGQRFYKLLIQKLHNDAILTDVLLVLKSLHNQRKITEQELELCIQVFQEMMCYEAVKQLNEHRQYQKTLTNEDNKMTSVVNPSMNNKSFQSQSLIHKISLIRITKYDVLLFILNFLFISVSIIIWRLKAKSSESTNQSAKVLVVKRGILHGQTIGGLGAFSDANVANLNFSQRITGIESYLLKDASNKDVLGCVKFSYSHNGRGHEYGCFNGDRSQKTFKKMILHSTEVITQVTTYEEHRMIPLVNSTGSCPILVGIELETNYGRKESFGIKTGRIKTENIQNYFVGFVYGKSGGYIDCLRFVWYKDCLKNSLIDK